LTVVSSYAQTGQPPTPNLDGALAKLFGQNTGFSATLEFHVTRSSGSEMIMPGKIAFLDGKSRFDMDLSNMQGGQMPAQTAARMKRMGMGRISTLTLPGTKVSYLIYPDMKAYMENPTQNTSAAPTDYKTEVTKLGEETIDSHNCVKNKVVVTGPDGPANESIVWNASDLNQFPVKIQVASGNGADTVLLFKDIKLDKPDATLFDLPADFTKYDNMMSLMMSRARGATGQ
jgi:hypothetical protein